MVHSGCFDPGLLGRVRYSLVLGGLFKVPGGARSAGSFAACDGASPRDQCWRGIRDPVRGATPGAPDCPAVGIRVGPIVIVKRTLGTPIPVLDGAPARLGDHLR